jgi:hypothetical protein
MSDENSKSAYRKENPTSCNIKNYTFAVESIKEGKRCALDGTCEWFGAKQNERDHYDLKWMIFCVTCDQVYHLRCTSVNVLTLTEKQLL